MLILRDPQAIDLPPLYALALDTQKRFLDDYHSFDIDYAKRLLTLPATQVIDFYGYAVGAAWFDDQVDELRATMHLLVRPESWRGVIKEGLLPRIINHAFDTLGIAKIIAEPISTQKSAIKLLRQFKFYEHKPFYKHTKQNGIIVDMIPFELRRNYWRRQNG